MQGQFQRIDPPARKPYPNDASEENWAFVAPCLTRCREDASKHKHRTCDVFEPRPGMVKTGTQWRYVPDLFHPWAEVQQTQVCVAVSEFATLGRDNRARDPTPVVANTRML